jgi:branched-chain amino acid transport system permease protein
MEIRMSVEDENGPINRDDGVRAHFDRMTRAYLLSVLDDELIEEHRTGDGGHPSEPLSRLLAWCHRRPLSEQYAIKAEADGTFRLVSFSGQRGQPPRYLGEDRYPTVQEARHGVFLRHIQDLTEK